MGLERLNEFKKRKGLTNAQLAEITGITISTIDKITSGNNINPKLRTIEALCQALDCSLDDIIGFDAPQVKEQKDTKKEQLINNYELLNDDGKEDLLDYSDMLASNPRKLKEGNQTVQGLKNA